MITLSKIVFNKLKKESKDEEDSSQDDIRVPAKSPKQKKKKKSTPVVTQSVTESDDSSELDSDDHSEAQRTLPKTVKRNEVETLERTPVRKSGRSNRGTKKREKSLPRNEKGKKHSSDDLSEAHKPSRRSHKRSSTVKKSDQYSRQSKSEDRDRSIDIDSNESKKQADAMRQSMYKFNNKMSAKAFNSELTKSMNERLAKPSREVDRESPFIRNNMSHKSNPNLATVANQDRFSKTLQNQNEPRFSRQNRFYQSNPDLLKEPEQQGFGGAVQTSTWKKQNEKTPMVVPYQFSNPHQQNYQMNQQQASNNRKSFSENYPNTEMEVRSKSPSRFADPAYQIHLLEQQRKMPYSPESNYVRPDMSANTRVVSPAPKNNDMPLQSQYYKKQEQYITKLNQTPGEVQEVNQNGRFDSRNAQEMENSELEALGCFHPDVNRVNSETRLRDFGVKDGSYLLRRSQSPKADIVISVLFGVSVKHFLINRNRMTGLYFLGQAAYEQFNDITSLLRHLNEHGIDDNKYRVTFPLAYPVVQGSLRPEHKAQSMEHLDQWFIPQKELKLSSKVLGSGRFGIVYQGMLSGRKKVAVKTIRDVTYCEIGDLRSFSRETEMLKNLRHPRLTTFYGITDLSDGKTGIIMEYLTNGNLLEYLWDVRKWVSGLKSSKKAAFALEVAEGMNYLESQRVIHRDLAARNILLSEDMRVKIADFGYSTFLKEDTEILNDVTHTPLRWMAIESICNKEFSSRSDMWSYGILLLEIYTLGDCPYPEFNDQEVVYQLQQGYRSPRPKDCPVNVFENIIVHCWKENPVLRPSFREIMNMWQDLASHH